MSKVFIISEIGINHNGDLDLAKKMIKESKDCGADSVKFQKRDIDLVYDKETLASKRESPWGSTFREQKEGLEFNEEQYQEIDKYCKQLDVTWFSSAWDLNSLKFLEKFSSKYNKVASAMIIDKTFLNEVAMQKKYTFISTGMSNFKIIDNAVEIFSKNNCEFELMHCISEYPFDDKLANLNMINILKKRYGCNVGYSGHRWFSNFLCCNCLESSLERHLQIESLWV